MIDPRHVALLAGTALATFATPAFAQDAAPAPTTATPKAATPAADTGEDVVVTARFRNESLQSVPIAITAVSGQSLAERQLNTVENIAATIPSVGFRSGASNKDRTIFIRGVGTITTSPGVEPSVSTVLDGVVLTRPGQSTLDLGEVERIEVLRGPQGTLFGKNASAGVVNIVTRNPTDEFRMFGEAGVTSDEEYRDQDRHLGRDRARQGPGTDRRPL
ncbi:TonB-dependent receptor plug domain-containing protein [Sphingomonas aerolata]|uniref:TonB-dependent receptor plug domain-containing protein n=1 Tax=Sphingomonas aerolata TaxID=185951 RepID=UPI002FE228E2